MNTYPETTKNILQSCVTENIPALLMGETGTGKTTLIRQLAQTHNKELVRINLNGDTSREDLLGKYQLKAGKTYWQDGPLLGALIQGNWILLDEINAARPDVLFVLQALIESKNKKLGNITLTEKEGEKVVPHEETRIFATCNPIDYVGVSDFNMATLSRFIVVKIDEMNLTDEIEFLLQEYSEAKRDIVVQLCVFAQHIREEKKKGDLSVWLSTRDLEQCVSLLINGIEPHVAATVTLLNKFHEPDERSFAEGKLVKAMGLGVELCEAIVNKKEINRAIQEEAEKLEEQMSKANKLISSYKNISL